MFAARGRDLRRTILRRNADMFSMTVAACAGARSPRRPRGGRADRPGGACGRRSRPGGAGLGIPSRPHRRLRRQPGRQRGAEQGRRTRQRLWYSYGGSSCSWGYDCSAWRRRPSATAPDLAAAFDLLDAGEPAPAPDLAVAGPARRPDVLRLWARGSQHDLEPQTFGAHHSGQRVGREPGAVWHPTAAYRVW